MILAALARQERVRHQNVFKRDWNAPEHKAALVCRPQVNRAADPDASMIRKLRDEGQSYGEIADELGRSKSDIYRVCMTLGCAAG